MKWLLLKSWDKPSPSLHACPITPWWTGNPCCGQAKLMPAGRNGTSQNFIIWDEDTTSLQTQPKIEFSHLEMGATWSLESLTFQRLLLFLLWPFHYCKVYVKALLFYSSEELDFIITHFPFVLSKRSDIFIVFLILMYSNFPKRCFMHPW